MPTGEGGGAQHPSAFLVRRGRACTWGRAWPKGRKTLMRVIRLAGENSAGLRRDVNKLRDDRGSVSKAENLPRSAAATVNVPFTIASIN